MVRLSLILALCVACSAAQAEQKQRTFYGADGRVTSRETIGTNGATTIYDASGRVAGRTTTSGNTTTLYNAAGQKAGTFQSK